ncbi:MAG: DUF423 domain-containing protein [Caulobacteraceae bacterium]|nr:DUF423 domain-containing protein [Caulobacteraceae bacterium]
MSAAPAPPRLAFGWAGLLGLSAVAAGAFGAHAVSDPVVKGWLQTGGQYGMVHALAAVAALWLKDRGAPLAGPAAWAFLVGASLFSGSLYVLALTGQRLLGAVTPIGGVLMLAAWAMLAWSGFTLPREPQA